MQKHVAEIYKKREQDFSQKQAETRKKLANLAQLRLLIFLLAAFLAGYSIYSNRGEFALYALGPALLFIILVVIYRRLLKNMAYLENMVNINQVSLQRLSWQWPGFIEKGEQYARPEHPYSIDLNIFGRGSLFQYINTTVTLGGEEALADLLKGQVDPTAIGERQESIKELSEDLPWRQHFQATGMEAKVKKENPSELVTWAKDQQAGAVFPDLLLLLPAFTLLLFLLYYLGYLPLPLPLAFVAIQYGVLLSTRKKIHHEFDRTQMASDRLKQYAAVLKCIEDAKFNAPRLRHLQDSLSGERRTASRQIKALAGIVELTQFRYSQPILYFPVNTILFWDLFTAKKLAAWKSSSGTFLGTWFNVISEVEALACLAGLAHDNPGWTYPEVTLDPPYFQASSLGHPLINPEERVCNDVTLPSPGTALIITGSNMSGKSTLLRTLGLNLVLAYTGAPVCVKTMKTAYLPIYSKMQVADDLSQGVSTYYAELTRIKMVIDAARSGKPIIYLLDEIFKGTNSQDRILGTKAVIRILSGYPTLGLLTTHDLELAALADENPGLIKNYHFDDQIENNQISFDYQLKEGVSTSTNAIALMKMVGIDVEEV